MVREGAQSDGEKSREVVINAKIPYNQEMTWIDTACEEEIRKGIPSIDDCINVTIQGH